MIRKSVFFLIFIFALNIFAFAQTGMLGGKIELDEGGKKTPYANAVVEAFRTDVKGKLPTAKSNGKGNFTFVGVQFGGTYVISVSGPDIEPTIYPDLRPDKTDIVITVVKGSGKRLTEDEVKARLNSAPQTTTNTGLTAEQKAKMAEEQKKYDEAKAKRDKEMQAQDIMAKAYSEALKAWEAKNYELAITKADEGIAAVPDYAGSTSVALNLKANALFNLGADTFNKIKTNPDRKAELMETAKKYWNDSNASAKQGIDIINQAIGTPKNSSAGSIAPINSSASGLTEEEKKSFANTRLKLYQRTLETYRTLVVNEVDPNVPTELAQMFDEFQSMSTEQKSKAWAFQSFGDILRKSYNYADAIVQYKKFLELSPDDPDGLAYLGLCLYTNGLIKKEDKATAEQGKAEIQEGLNILGRFIEITPTTYPNQALKQSVKEIIDSLKANEKMTPQKTKKP